MGEKGITLGRGVDPLTRELTESVGTFWQAELRGLSCEERCKWAVGAVFRNIIHFAQGSCPLGDSRCKANFGLVTHINDYALAEAWNRGIMGTMGRIKD